MRRNKIPLAFLSRRDNHLPAATAKMARLTVAAFSSRLSRYNGPASETYSARGRLVQGRGTKTSVWA